MEEVKPSDKAFWVTVVSGADLRSYFEGKRKPQGIPLGPQVYRFLFSDGNGLPKASYRGESGDFSVRIRRYRNCKTRDYTERHLREFLSACRVIDDPEQVQLQVLSFEDLEIFGLRVLSAHLSRPYVRRPFEAWAILRDSRARIRVLNVSRDEATKDLRGRQIQRTSRANRYRAIDALEAGIQ